MNSATGPITTGCPVTHRHTQAPGLETSDPLEAINAGNYKQAIQLLEARLAGGEKSQKDQELLAYSRFASEDWQGAARDFRTLLEIFPSADNDSKTWWKDNARRAETALKTGEGVARANILDKVEADRAALQGVRASTPAKHWYPRGTFLDTAKVWAIGAVLDAVGYVVQAGMWAADRLFDRQEWYKAKARLGLMESLPKLIGQQILAVYRDRALAARRIPPGAEKAAIKYTNRSRSGFSSDGTQVDPDYANAGGVGDGTPVHGPGGEDEITGFEHLLPSPALVAQTFLYRKDGVTIEVPYLNALTADHLFELPHDVKQTLFDDKKRDAIETAPNSPEAKLGITTQFVPANVVDEVKGHLSATTGQWDGDQWYGRHHAEVVKMRTNPHTGEVLPNGQIYLEDGKWIPEVEHENGVKTLRLPIDGNRTVGSVAVATTYLREHNRRCEVYAKRHPDLVGAEMFAAPHGFEGDAIYWMARRAVVGSYAKEHTMHWTPSTFGHPTIVSGLHINGAGLGEGRKPLHEMEIFKPGKGTHEIWSGLLGNTEIAEHFDHPDFKGEDFAEAYRAPGHTMQPKGYNTAYLKIGATAEEIAGGEIVPVEDLLGVAGNTFLKEHGLGAVMNMLMHTPMGAPTLHNHPDFMSRMPSNGGPTHIGEVDVERGRQRGTGNYVGFYRRQGLPEPEKYEDIIDTSTPEGLQTVEDLERLYGEYNKATGKLYVDTVVGQLADKNKPRFTAVPNSTFFVFLSEASARLMHNPGLSAGLHPENLGMTAANSVQEDWFADLVYRHGGADNPEFKKAMRDRPHPMIYSNMGNPDDAHPTEDFVDYKTGENLAGDGYGLPYLQKHYEKNGVEGNHVVRVSYGDNAFIVDTTDERVWVDHDGDGRIHTRDGVFELPTEAGVSTNELITAARGQGRSDLRVGSDLSSHEKRLLIEYGYDENKAGVLA